MKEWDQSVFDRTLQEYLGVTSRSLADALNTKGYYISRGAIFHTVKASPYAVRNSLGAMVRADRLSKSGKVIHGRKLQLAQANDYEAPLAALIINKRRGKNSLKGFYGGGLYGAAMAAAIKALLASRIRSLAFIKSGWIAAVRVFEPLADRSKAPPTDNEAKQRGQSKGRAQPATPGFQVRAVLENMAVTKHSPSGKALLTVGAKGLQIAVDNETASMNQYLKDRLGPDAAAFNRLQK